VDRRAAFNMQKTPINPVLLARAREMRVECAPAEQKLWRCLRDRQLGGFKFRRQHVVGAYIADFYCHDCRLIVEIDGESHGHRESYDAARTQILDRAGDQVIRFANEDVHDFLDAVLEVILEGCERIRNWKPPSP
jgi:very-short-patch-repair endonuclease